MLRRKGEKYYPRYLSINISGRGTNSENLEGICRPVIRKLGNRKIS